MSGRRPFTRLASAICSFRPAPAMSPRPRAGSRRACSTFAPAPGVEISEGVLYRARIAIPSQVPVGTYTAETFLIQDGRVLAVATRDIQVGKSGFERWVTLVARRHEGLYGLAAVIMSIGLGWAAAMIFRRRF
jgi:uncharacterized protein (TIGR02186 family)